MNLFIYFFHLRPRRPGVSAGGREEEGKKRNQHIGEVPSKSHPLPSPPRAARRPRFDSRPCFQLRCKCIDFRCCWVGWFFFFFPLPLVFPSLLFGSLRLRGEEALGDCRWRARRGTKGDWGRGPRRTDGQTESLRRRRDRVVGGKERAYERAKRERPGWRQRRGTERHRSWTRSLPDGRRVTRG